MPKVPCAVDCQDRTKVRWLWEPYIPRGRITIMDGDPGLGKSFITLDLGARITTGTPWPNQSEDAETPPPSNVLILNCEDEQDTTITPRLKAAGANLTRVFYGAQIIDEATNRTLRFLRLPDDESLLEDFVVQTQAVLVVIDPVMAFLSDKVKTNSDQSVRHALDGLNLIGQRTGAAFLLVRHLNKGGGQKAIYRGGGSIGFVGLARSALMVAKNPDQPNQTLLLHSKSNLARQGPSLIFELTFHENVGKVRWRGESEITANQALREETPPTAVERAVQFLRTILAPGKELPVTEIIRQAKLLNISPRSVTRAKKKLLIFSRRKSQGWCWSLERKEDSSLNDFLADLPTREP